MLLESDLPSLKMDFLELHNSNWRVLNGVGKWTSRAFQQYIIVHTLFGDWRRNLALNAKYMLLSGVKRQKNVMIRSWTPKTRHNLEFDAKKGLYTWKALVSAPAHTKWAPEVDFCTNYLSLFISCKPRVLVYYLNNFYRLILYLMTFSYLNYILFDGMSL